MVGEGRPNLLLLTIDAWRADFLGSFSGVQLTPTLNSFAHHTLRFEQVYSTGPWTTPGVVSILTGEDALSHAVWYPWSSPRSGGAALASLLGEAGYTIMNYCYKTAADNYQNLGYDPALAEDYPTGPNDDFLPRSLGRLANDGQAPWFAWYHYKYVHLPYWPDQRYRRMFGVGDDRLSPYLLETVCKQAVLPRGEVHLSPDDTDILRRLYAANVRQMDDFLARVLTSLDQSGQLSNTTIVITADHGDELLEHGHVGHASTARWATLFEEVLRIPLLIIDSRIKGPRLNRDRVQLQDLMPTILSMAGLRPPPLRDAINLGALVDCATRGTAGDPVTLSDTTHQHRALRFHSSRMGYQTQRHGEAQAIVGFLEQSSKYILERFETEKRQLFDLAVDPAEQAPITSGPLVDAAHQRLLELYPDLDKHFTPAPRRRGLHQRLSHSLQVIRSTTRQLRYFR